MEDREFIQIEDFEKHQPGPKRTGRQEQRRRRLRLERVDRLENAKVHDRSGGRCEFWTLEFQRCYRLATQVHHFLGGIGVRGGSELARNKIHVCQACHDFIGRNPTRVSFDRTNAFATLEVFP